MTILNGGKAASTTHDLQQQAPASDWALKASGQYGSAWEGLLALAEHLAATANDLLEFIRDRRRSLVQTETSDPTFDHDQRLLGHNGSSYIGEPGAMTLLAIKNERRSVVQTETSDLPPCPPSFPPTPPVSPPYNPPKETPEKNTKKAPLAADDAGFVEFWAAYPRKVAKAVARKAWAKLDPDAALRVRILQALKLHRAIWTEPKFVPHPATWLNQARWEDELSPDDEPLTAERMLAFMRGQGQEPAEIEEETW